MGQNLIMNVADHGFKVVAFNRTVAKVDRFLENEAKGNCVSLGSWDSSIAETVFQATTTSLVLIQSKSSV